MLDTPGTDARAPIAVEIPGCRLCKETAKIGTVLDLGTRKLSQFPRDLVESMRGGAAPLELLECGGCGLVQLAHTVRPELLFQDTYWYASGINGTMREELRNVVREARGWVKVKDGDWVLDIGANDGTLLSAWREHAWEGRPYRAAVEPSPTFNRLLGDQAEMVLQELFPTDKLDICAGRFRVITSIAMFYAVADPIAFARSVASLLTDDGVWVVQMQDLHNMVRGAAFDNICHEHLAYYSIKTFWSVCLMADLKIVSVQPREINGGSLRFIVQKLATGEVNHCPPIVEPKIDWQEFDQTIDLRVDALRATVEAALAAGHQVDLLGASTKGNTLLQLAGLGSREIRQAWERHPNKVGRMTVTGIPIVHEDVGRANPPQLLICPIWQFREALIEREHEFLRAGGRIYFPLPEGELYFGEGVSAGT